MQCQLNILSPGLLSLLVDDGRKGMQALGFSGAGPMDQEAFVFANWLCGNDDNTPAIEVIGNAEFSVTQDVVFAVCGPDVEIKVDGETKATWSSQRLRQGQTLSLQSKNIGQRIYVAVGGTWEVPYVAGSACCVMREKLGGLDEAGAPLQAGEHIPLAVNMSSRPQRNIPTWLQPDYLSDAPIDVVMGYQVDAFDTVALARFFDGEYTVTAKSDRMGMRLQGESIPSNMTNMRSEGINIGSVQVPADGQPIIMLADRQTLGGYPKLGVVALYDLPRLVQSVAGSSLHFCAIEANDARSKWLLRHTRIHAFFKDN